VATFGGRSPADAAEAPVGLGTAASFAVLGAQTVTNTGPSVISGDLGVSPLSAVTGFPPGIVVNGVIHAADAVAAQAQADLTVAYNDAAGRATTAALPPDIGGLTLVSGVYTASSSLGLTGTVTLDAQGDPNAVFIFQVGTTLTTASFSTVSLINGASPCNVYWQIGSSATLGTNSVFVGTVMALASISATTGTTVQGRSAGPQRRGHPRHQHHHAAQLRPVRNNNHHHDRPRGLDHHRSRRGLHDRPWRGFDHDRSRRRPDDRAGGRHHRSRWRSGHDRARRRLGFDRPG